MRIALYHNLTLGGSKREAHELARQLSAHGHRVDVFQPSTAEEQFLPLADTAGARYSFNLRLIPDLPLRVPGLSRYIGLVGWYINVLRVRRLSRTIAQKIDDTGYDFVFAHHDRLIQSPFLFAALQTPSAYYCAEPMREFYEPPIRRPYHFPRSRLARAQRAWYAPAQWLRRRIARRADWQNVQFATRLLTNSYFSAEAIYRAYGLRARVSYLGVDHAKFRPLGSTRQNIVLSVGAVAPYKSYDFLLEALAKLPGGARPRLVIAANSASPGETNYLHAIAAEREVNLDIRVNISDDELVQLYNQARVFVYAPVMEPFGLAPLEAMACGTPIVAVKEGGVRESVIDDVTGRLTAREPAVFAAALGELLASPVQCERLGCSGRAEVERFWTWPLAYERFMQNLSGLV